MGLSFLGAQPPGVPNPTLSPRLLAEKRQELLDQANKLRTGLFKIDETRDLSDAACAAPPCPTPAC